MKNFKTVALALILIMIAGCVVGTSLAWLTAESGPVENTFSASHVDVTLTEDGAVDNVKKYDMVPGYVLDKNPQVTVAEDSEDCYVFVTVTESGTPNLDDYIKYAIADGWTELNNNTPENSDELVLYRVVKETDTTRSFGILDGGTHTFTNGTGEETDDIQFSWDAGKVLVLPEVTEKMMDELTANPTLKFKAYAIQYYKSNNTPFGAAEAWGLIPKN